MNSCRYILVAFALALSFTGLAQFPYFHAFQDTFRPGNRISGSFDSVDIYVAEYQTTLPTRWRPAYDLFTPENLFTTNFQSKPFQFSAIAHVGLQYALGSNNTQRAGISYTHALTQTQFIQMDYQRRSTSGAIRNSNLEEANFLDLQYLFRKRRYAQKLNILFDGDEQSLSGGLLNDSIREGFDLIFSDVQNVSAGHRRRRFDIESQNYFSFTADSLIKTGIYLTPQLSIRNRLFTETNDFDTLYGYYLIDTLNTYDHWEKSQAGGVAGYFLETQRFAISGGIRMRYWDFDNLGNHYDTTETAIVGSLRLNPLQNLHIAADGEFNFAGAVGESILKANSSYSAGRLSFRANAGFSSLYPELYQRHLHGNQYDYSWNNRQLIKKTSFDVSAAYSGNKTAVSVSAGFMNYQDFPFFLNNRWKQDTLTNFSILHASVRANIRLGKFFIQPSLRFQSSGLSFMPSAQLFGRAGFDGYLFRAKKLRAAIGIEGGYISSFTLLDYIPYMGTYVLPQNDSWKFNAMPKLSAFAQFELGFLRWFVRVENIEQTFTPVNYEAIGYPHVPVQIRLGISWDIFN